MRRRRRCNPQGADTAQCYSTEMACLEFYIDFGHYRPSWNFLLLPSDPVAMAFISRFVELRFFQAIVKYLPAWNLRQMGQWLAHSTTFLFFFQKIHFLTISIANCQALRPLDDAVVGQVRHVFTLLFLILVFACICFFNFVVLWSRRDRVYFRCAIVIMIDLVSLVMALALCRAFNSLQHDAPDLPIRHKGRSYHILRMTAYDAIVHVSTVIFWIWLLPAKLRFPNRYEPVITKYRRWDSAEGNPLMFQYGDSFPLAQLFQHQERNWKWKRDSMNTVGPLQRRLIPNNVLMKLLDSPGQYDEGRCSRCRTCSSPHLARPAVSSRSKVLGCRQRFLKRSTGTVPVRHKYSHGAM